MAAGYCTLYISVSAYCPVSCNSCPTTAITLQTTAVITQPVIQTTTTVCKDSDTSACSQYLAAGYCTLYTSVSAYCPVSCNSCPTTTTTKSNVLTTTGTTQPVIQTTTTVCKDSDSSACSQYLAAGYCTLYTSVSAYCPVSCNSCPTTANTIQITTVTTQPVIQTTTTVCKDSDTSICPQYYAAGYCTQYIQVLTYCPVSCKLCPVTTTQTTLTNQISNCNPYPCVYGTCISTPTSFKCVCVKCFYLKNLIIFN